MDDPATVPESKGVTRLLGQLRDGPCRGRTTRCGAPLVLVTDNKSGYIAAGVERSCAEHAVLHLLNKLWVWPKTFRIVK